MFFQAAVGQVSTFTTIFLGIFIEAAPFLLLGTIASGMVEVFVNREEVVRLIPRNTVLATLVGALLGLIFPVCECGVVPLTRRLMNKGLPASAGVAFLLAAPIVNPVVLASTYAAYGWGRMLAARVGMGLVVSTTVGLVFSLKADPAQLLRHPVLAIAGGAADDLVVRPVTPQLQARIQQALRIAGDEFFEMGRYLVIGALLAALLQTVIPQSALKTLGASPVLSVLVMLLLAYVLSVCSTVDAFLSLTFVNTFTTGSILAFLVFGPMVDMKSTLMFSRVFKRKYVAYLVVLPFLMVSVLTIFINSHLSW